MVPDGTVSVDSTGARAWVSAFLAHTRLVEGAVSVGEALWVAGRVVGGPGAPTGVTHGHRGAVYTAGGMGSAGRRVAWLAGIGPHYYHRLYGYTLDEGVSSEALKAGAGGGVVAAATDSAQATDVTQGTGVHTALVETGLVRAAVTVEGTLGVTADVRVSHCVRQAGAEGVTTHHLAQGVDSAGAREARVSDWHVFWQWITSD